MIFPPNISAIASSSAWLPLLYDSVVLVLTLLKTVPLVRKNWGSFTGHLPWKRLVEDGLLYYTAICSVTLVLTIMIVSAPPGLKNIAAQLELLITVQMMSRITLNLKKFGHQGSQDSFVRDTGPIVFYPASARLRAEINLQNSRTAYRAPEIGV
ncbi:hypothetical protein B0H13DRAFT_2535463 [Mycena leptocephala]|nr:hypothetical protein B0H13DRAFT_2535463 [Mycena leptocephala]